MNLQSTIAAATAYGDSFVGMHHPITCQNGELYYDEEGALSCDHVKCPPEDSRTQAALIHSMAILLIELALEL